MTTKIKKSILTCLLFVGLFQNCVAQTPGAPYFIPTGNSSSNGSAVVLSYYCETASIGTLTVGTAVSGVTHTITATVLTAGTYNIAATANGVTYAASGTFAGTGSQNIVLTATGTPTLPGSFSYALNTTPGCSYSRITVMPPLPGNITLSAVSDYYIASILDSDYRPYSTPTGVAELPSGATSETADGINETPAINIQGTLTTTGVTIKIPYTVTTASVNLPAFSKTITIPAAFTEDNISRDVTFSYNAVTLAVGSGSITATLKALIGPLNVKKLDIQSGIGNDSLGLLLGQFPYSINSSGGSSIFEFRAIPGILDKMFGIADLTGDYTTHLMMYLPVFAADGKTWLNNNLGAHYSDSTHSSFNIGQQATSKDDFLAYGSLFQWGRYPYGHELINYTSSTNYTIKNPTLGFNITAYSDDINILYFMNVNVTADWRSPSSTTLWSSESSPSNPCPKGYRVPTNLEFDALVSAEGITYNINAASSSLKFTTTRIREVGSDDILITNNDYTEYWTSVSFGSPFTSARTRHFSFSQTLSFSSYKGRGLPVRCIKD